MYEFNLASNHTVLQRNEIGIFQGLFEGFQMWKNVNETDESIWW